MKSPPSRLRSTVWPTLCSARLAPITATDPGNSSRWIDRDSARLLRGYGPLIGVALILAVVALFMPTVGQKVVTRAVAGSEREAGGFSGHWKKDFQRHGMPFPAPLGSAKKGFSGINWSTSLRNRRFPYSKYTQENPCRTHNSGIFP